MAQNYVLLERIELNASASSVTFSNIPQTGYTDLKVVMSLRSTSSTGNYDVPIYRLNSSASGYTARDVAGNGSAANSGSNTTMASTAGWTGGRMLDFGINNGSSTASTFSNLEMYIPNYTSSNQKSLSLDSVSENNASNAYAEMSALLWSGTSSITTLDFSLYYGSFVVGCSFSLYGLAAVGTTPAIAPKADGGNVIATDGTYWYHAFLSNGTFTPSLALNADVLIIAGGGGGGMGGGGAGGVITYTAQSLSVANYSIGIGGGGAAGANGTNGTQGTSTTFTGLTTAIGGGSGAGVASATGGSGGSGGGGRYASTVGGTGSQGSNGGTGGPASGAYGDGGGGGYSQVGGNGTSSLGGKGGDGISTYSTWGSATGTGQNVSGTYWYAGGGGGGADSSPGVGGSGGGSAGVINTGVIAATANTGGGGGGSSNGTAATGGSGIVIVRYLVA